MQSAPRGPRPPSMEVKSRPRKLSARRSSDTSSFLSRKLSKQQQPPEQRPQRQAARHVSQSSVSQESGGKGKGKEIEQPSPQEQPRPQFPHKSVIPDQLAELPAWYAKDIEATASSAIQFRAKYPIHNPMGPRWYRNHHLAPPSLDKRPPSFFSPSFPPMAASQTRSQDSAKVPGPSRTPSGSPLPTPSSSQVRIHDVRVRTRKLSNTAHDNVDMMDVSDPWGTNWHHQSPYDLGAVPDRAPDTLESPSVPRPRRMSMTSTPRHKTAAPSPLSQSTSAVHLASEPLTTGRIPRRLSKRRKPFNGLFGSDGGNDTRRTGSAPVTPIEFGQALGRKISKTGSFIAASIAPSTNSLTPTEKRAKRGSVFGRLARRFSVLKRTDTSKSTPNGIQSARVSMDMTYDQNAGLPYSIERRSVSPQKQPQESPPRRSKTDAPKRRIPIPSQFERASIKSPTEREPEADAQSMSSVEEPSSVGRLTVANPDDSFNSEEAPQMAPQSSVSSSDDAPGHSYRVLGEELRASPTPMDSMTHVPRAPLSVISEGETYLSSPKAPPAATPQLAPMSPPTIPSVLSLPLLRKPPSDALPLSPTPPELPPTAPSKMEHSLPPTPHESRSPTPELVKPTESAPSFQHKSREALPPTSISLPSIPGSSVGYVENTPLSRVSMIVNPPTPQPPAWSALPTSPPPQRSVALPAAAPPAPSPLAVTPPSQELPHQERTPSREPSPSKRDNEAKDKDGHQRTRSRRTETFKLVRTSSGHVQTVDGVFAAEGEHWQVVESPKEESPRKRQERSKTNESDSVRRSESKKAEKEKESASDDSDQQRKFEYRRRSVSHKDTSASVPQAAAPPLPRTRSPEMQVSRPNVPEKPDRRRSTRESREVREPQPEAVRSTQTPVTYATPNTAKQSASYGPSVGARVDRHPSTSTRPSSELNSLAELNTLKAADAWEIERLWKGRSMIYGTEGTALPGTRHNITSDSRPSTIMSADLHRASSIPSVDQASSVGTSHTYFVYQAPSNGAGSHQVSSAQALYPSYLQQPAASKQEGRRQSRSPTGSLPFPSSNPTQLPSPRANPLPEPPRISAYRPPPIPASLAGDSDTTTTSEYWMKLAGVTVSP